MSASIGPEEAVRLLRAMPDAASQRIADLICALSAALGHAAQNARSRAPDHYEASAAAARRGAEAASER